MMLVTVEATATGTDVGGGDRTKRPAAAHEFQIRVLSPVGGGECRPELESRVSGLKASLGRASFAWFASPSGCRCREASPVGGGEGNPADD